jgi:hypothetical protein
MLQRGTRANTLEYADTRKRARAICRGKKRECEDVACVSFKIDILKLCMKILRTIA